MKLYLLSKLSAAQKQKVEGDQGKTIKQVITKIRETINAN